MKRVLAAVRSEPSAVLLAVQLLLVLLFPVLLLGFMLFMQRVEEPLNHIDDSREIEQMIEQADPADIDALVAEGADNALRRFRRRTLPWRRRG